MKVMVFDVPASMGGALTILKGFHAQAVLDHDVQWEFILNRDDLLPHSERVQIKAFPWVKKSWLHRLFFDKFYTRRLVCASRPDVIFSLQNVRIQARGVRQVLYIHQSIPFSDIHFCILKNPVEWIYQHFIGRMICRSAKLADQCIVQTDWMKDALLHKTGLASERVLVIAPECTVETEIRYCDTLEHRKTFFYPAACNSYKNHRLIIQAARLLVAKEITDFVILFTLKPCDTIDTERIAGLPQIQCVGQLPYEQVLRTYAESVLVFPSRLETFGLPLLEAALLDSRILASDKPFAREILTHYPNVTYFDADSAQSLAKQMEGTLSGQIPHHPTNGMWRTRDNNENGWEPVVALLKQ